MNRKIMLLLLGIISFNTIMYSETKDISFQPFSISLLSPATANKPVPMADEERSAPLQNACSCFCTGSSISLISTGIGSLVLGIVMLIFNGSDPDLFFTIMGPAAVVSGGFFLVIGIFIGRHTLSQPSPSDKEKELLTLREAEKGTRPYIIPGLNGIRLGAKF
ncbi:MAG: hypothetical protein JW904_03220 [Spirochaetales bacterium]|nr:hypothetical protein [Spirochaetales bacterium]